MPSPTREDLIPAAKRFNRWQFPEARNFFKELSSSADGSDQEFLEAVSDVAEGFSKIWHKGGEPHAMVSSLSKGTKSLEKFTPRYLEIELTEFTKHLNTCLEEAKRWRRGDVEIFDRDLIPRLEFAD
ncbi:MAG: hypothetical protein KC561_06350 [Myxococcales bacterium]|nr:hypothetical protein [Myxococcales bacterium]